MSYITRNLKQNETYWSPGTNDGFGGRNFGSPTALKGRWEDTIELFVDVSGNEVTSLAKVYLAVDVENKGYLFLGTSTGADPTSVSDAREIRSFKKIPNLKGTLFERLAML